MDERDKERATNATVTGLVGGLVAGPPGAVIGGLIGGALEPDTSPHDAAIHSTATQIADTVDDTGTLYVDHVDADPADDGGTAAVIDDLDHNPDLIYQTQPGSGYSNLIIEVETWDGLQDDPGHAISQLHDFRVRGYKRLLVVPEREIEDFAAWVNQREADGTFDRDVRLTHPGAVTQSL